MALAGHLSGSVEARWRARRERPEAALGAFLVRRWRAGAAGRPFFAPGGCAWAYA